MVEKNPILCPECKAVVIEDERSTRFFLLKEDIKCPHCGAVVVRSQKTTW